ncbi:tumor suppressor candidate 2-like [Tubulanus polymorphus]|uniref:tumor suppressor candidate 2-like n=1 Tax=Tubulanus polymorphus TaxID=672921 RepID=UPI003DA28C7F
MGQASSRAAKKVVSPLYNYWYGGNSGQEDDEQSDVGAGGAPYYWRTAVTPFVYKRKSSLYIDEDGDLANEFYEEVMYEEEEEGIFRTTMRRILHHLTPLGYIDLPHPCLHYNMPVILCETPATCR